MFAEGHKTVPVYRVEEEGSSGQMSKYKDRNQRQPTTLYLTKGPVF